MPDLHYDQELEGDLCFVSAEPRVGETFGICGSCCVVVIPITLTLIMDLKHCSQVIKRFSECSTDKLSLHQDVEHFGIVGIIRMVDYTASLQAFCPRISFGPLLRLRGIPESSTLSLSNATKRWSASIETTYCFFPICVDVGCDDLLHCCCVVSSFSI